MDYELEQKLLLDALRSAKESQQVGLNQHVPNSVKTPFGDMLVAHGPGTLLGNVATRGIGQFNERNAVQKARDLSAQEQGEYEGMLKELMTPGTRQVESYVGDEGPLPAPKMESVPLSPLEESRRRLDIYGKMSRLPKAAALAQAGIKSEVDFPERQAILEQQQAQQREQQAQRDQERWRFAQQFKLTGEQQKEIADARTAATANMPQIIAVQTVDADGHPVTRLIDKRTVKSGDEYVKPPPASGKGANAQTEKAKQATSDLLDKLTMAEQGLPYASGYGAVVPAGIRQAYTDENTKIADASIASLSAEKAHELYGAAFTAAEQARAAQFLPVTTGAFPDSVATLKAKFKALRMIAEKKQARLNGQPDPHPKMYNDILDPVAAPTGASEAPPPTSPAKGGKVNPNDEAAFAKYYDSLPNGASYVDPSGVRRIKGKK